MLHGILVARQGDYPEAPVDVFSYHLVDNWAQSDAAPVRCGLGPWCLGDRKLEHSSVSSGGRDSSDSSSFVGALVISSGFRAYTPAAECDTRVRASKSFETRGGGRCCL